MLQYESFHTVFSAPESMSKRLKNCIKGKISQIDTVRDLLSKMDLEEIRRLHEETIDTLKRNRVFPEGIIGGYVVVGMEWSCSVAQKNPTQTVLAGKTRWGNRAFPSERGLYDRREKACGVLEEETRSFCRCGCSRWIIL